MSRTLLPNVSYNVVDNTIRVSKLTRFFVYRIASYIGDKTDAKSLFKKENLVRKYQIQNILVTGSSSMMRRSWCQR